jgi:hypothetical protein
MTDTPTPALIRAVRAGCEAYDNFPCRYPNCNCSDSSAVIRIIRAAIAAFAEESTPTKDDADRLRAWLTNIVEAHDMRAELFTSHEDCAASLSDRARKALETTKWP